MLAYKEGDTVLQELHPATILCYLAVVVAGALLLTHPTLLLVILIPVLLTLFGSGGGPSWLSSVKYFVIMMVMFMVINALVNNLGRTILWSGGNLPVLGRVTISLEVLVYSLVMGLRLLIVYSAFILYNHILDPDRALSLLSGVFPRSTLLVALATKSIPYLGQQLHRVAEIQQTRGIRYHGGGLFQRARNRIPLLKVVFLSSLEDSFNLGESIQARAYGTGPRTCYSRLSIKPLDSIILLVSLAAAAVMAWSSRAGFGSLQFFPTLAGSLVSYPIIRAGGIAALCLTLPAAVNWGCARWRYFTWKT